MTPFTAQQRQRLANLGWSRRTIAFWEDFTKSRPSARDAWITGWEQHRPFKSTAREMTPDEVRAARKRQANVLTLDHEPLPFSDTELKTIVAEGIRDSVRAEINRLKGRVD